MRISKKISGLVGISITVFLVLALNLMPDVDAQIGSEFTLSNLRITDSSNLPLEVVIKDKWLQISAEVTNHKSTTEKYTFAAIIENENGEILTPSFSGELNPGQTFTSSVSWIPEARGDYVIKIVVWNDINEKKVLIEPQIFVRRVFDHTLPFPIIQTVSDKVGQNYGITFFTDSVITSTDFDRSKKTLTANIVQSPSSSMPLIIEIPRALMDDIYDVRHQGSSIPYNLETTVAKNIITISGGFNPEVSVLGLSAAEPINLVSGYVLKLWWQEIGGANNINNKQVNILGIEVSHKTKEFKRTEFQLNVPGAGIYEQDITTYYGIDNFKFEIDSLPGNSTNPQSYNIEFDALKINDKNVNVETINFNVVVVPEFNSMYLSFLLVGIFSLVILFGKSKARIFKSKI